MTHFSFATQRRLAASKAVSPRSTAKRRSCGTPGPGGIWSRMGERWRRFLFIFGVLAAVSALSGSVAAAAQPPARAGVSPPVRTGAEYVVAFQGSAAEAIGAIGNAGGIVLD